MDEVQQQLIELEIRYSHLSRTIEELNDVMVEQDRRLAKLEKENAGFREMFKNLEPTSVESPDE